MREIDVTKFFTNGTNKVTVVSISGTMGESIDPLSGKDLRIKALIHVECKVKVPTPHSSCDGCGARPPGPDCKDEAVLSFILANHDGYRLTFAQEENCEKERDRYPVRGWVRSEEWLPHAEGTHPSGLLCPDCVKAMQEALAARRKPST